MVDHTRISAPLSCSDDTTWGRMPVDIAFSNICDSSDFHPIRVSYGSDTSLESRYSIGIGFRSYLTRETGAVAVIRRDSSNAELVLGSTMDLFGANCKPGTLVTLDASSREVYWTDVELNLVKEGSWTRLTGQVLIRKTYPGKVNWLPSSLSEHIARLLSSAGAIRGHDAEGDGHFSGCTAAMIAALPTLEIRTFASEGSIKLSPLDYIRLFEEEERCRFRFRTTEYAHPLHIDPLMLDGKNVRVTSENVWNICDSNAEL